MKKNKNTSILTAELKLFLQLIQVDFPPGSKECVLTEKDIQWDEIVHISRRHQLVPLIYSRLRSLDHECIPSEIRDWLKSGYLKNLSRNVRLVNKLNRVMEILASKNIDVVPFKGPALAIQAFGDISMRIFNDLDFLVKGEHFQKVYDLLITNGYIPHYPHIGKIKKSWQKSGRDFPFKDNMCHYDFHQQVVQGPGIFHLDNSVWKNLSSIQMLYKEIPVLPVIETLLVLTLHGTHHGWDSFKWVVDIAFLIKSNPSLNWETLFVQAKKLHCLRMFYIALMLCQEMCALQLPHEVREKIKKDLKAKKLMQDFKEGLMGEFILSERIPVWAFPKCLDSFKDKVKYFFYYFFYPTPLDLMSIRLPDFLFPLYYFFRPFRLLYNTLKQALILALRNLGVAGK